MKRIMIAAVVAVTAFLLGDMTSSWTMQARHKPAQWQSSVGHQMKLSDESLQRTQRVYMPIRPVSGSSSFELQQMRDRIGLLEREVQTLRREIDDVRRRVNSPQMQHNETTEPLPSHAGAIIHDAT